MDEAGNAVFTSHYLKSRRHCCKSNCLHCPYGTTVKKLGIQFRDFSEDSTAEANVILSSFQKNLDDLKNYTVDNVKFIILKEKVIGLFAKNHIVIKELYLKEHFRDQDLSKELIESYFFA